MSCMPRPRSSTSRSRRLTLSRRKSQKPLNSGGCISDTSKGAFGPLLNGGPMAVTTKQVYEASDGLVFDTEQEARDHELTLELRPLINDLLDSQGVGQKVTRKRAGELMLAFALQLLSPPAPETESADE